MQKTGGKSDDKAALMAALKSVSLTDTPRGPIKFDHFGNVIGDFYVRNCEKADGKLINKTVKTYTDVSQFWTYDEKKFLQQPVYSRDFPPLKIMMQDVPRAPHRRPRSFDTTSAGRRRT